MNRIFIQSKGELIRTIVFSPLVLVGSFIVSIGLIRWFTGEMMYYNLIGEKSLVSGAIPYVSFAFEHPPGAYLYFFVIHLISFGLFPIIYPLLNWLFITLIGYTFKLITFTRLTDFLVLLLASPYILFRYDTLPAVLTYLSYRALVSFRYILSGFLLGLSIVVKLYPLIFLPLSIISLWRDKESGRGGVLLRFGIGFICGIIIPPVVLLVITDSSIIPGMWNSVIGYHVQRGLQIESIAGSLELMFNINSAKSILIHTFGSWNVTGISINILRALSVLQFIGLVIISTGYWFKTRRVDFRMTSIFPDFTVLLLSVFIIFNKVFSPQYVLLPLLFILEMGLKRRTEKYPPILFYCIILIFTYGIVMSYGSLLEGVRWAIALVLFRNVLVVVFTTVLARSIFFKNAKAHG